MPPGNQQMLAHDGYHCERAIARACGDCLVAAAACRCTELLGDNTGLPGCEADVVVAIGVEWRWSCRVLVQVCDGCVQGVVAKLALLTPAAQRVPGITPWAEIRALRTGPSASQRRMHNC